MRLVSRRDPFDHPDWIYEIKFDGYRCIAHVDSDGCRLISRNGNQFKRFGEVAADIHRELSGRSVILDGEIVCLDCDGRPQFWDLMRRRGEVYFCAFDLLSLDGLDLRGETLLTRKQHLRGIVQPHCTRILYVRHIEATGIDFFRVACEQDLEGIVAKHAHCVYGALNSWVKIKNRSYSQAAGRHEFFNSKARAVAR